MEGYLLQDWTSISAGSATTLVTQSELYWLDLLDYRDVIFWLEVRSRTLGGAGGIFMRYQTAPSKDDALFSSMVNAFFVVAATTPDIKKVLEAQNPDVPVCRWVRWQLQASAPTSDWGATFRIHCAVNKGGIR